MALRLSLSLLSLLFATDFPPQWAKKEKVCLCGGYFNIRYFSAIYPIRFKPVCHRRKNEGRNCYTFIRSSVHPLTDNNHASPTGEKLLISSYIVFVSLQIRTNTNIYVCIFHPPIFSFALCFPPQPFMVSNFTQVPLIKLKKVETKEEVKAQRKNKKR